MKRITFVIDSLKLGGSQKSVLTLASLIQKRGYPSTIFPLAQQQNPDFFELPTGLSLYQNPEKPLPDARWFDFRQHSRIRNRLRQDILSTNPEVIISFNEITNIKVLMALAGSSVPVLVSERTDPRFYHINWRWQLLRRIYYPRAAQVIVQSEELLPWARQKWPRWKTSVIHNPVLPPVLNPESVRPACFQKPYSIVTLGRLHPHKRFHLLIEAYQPIARQFPDWQLLIFGDGPSKVELQKQIADLQLEEFVRLPGAVADSLSVLQHADLYVMTSEFEGFPNAMAEAMSCGVPVISFGVSSGHKVCLRTGIDGLLIEDEKISSLTATLQRLMSGHDLRKEFSGRAREVVERFSEESVVEKWVEGITQG